MTVTTGAVSTGVADLAVAHPTVGSALPGRDVTVQLLDEIRYLGATQDYVGIHWNTRIARSVGHEDVVLHGPLVAAKALTLVTDWCGDQTAVQSYRVRYLSPVYLPDGQTVTLRLEGEVTRVQADHVDVEVRVSRPDAAAPDGGVPVAHLGATVRIGSGTAR